MSTGGSGVAGPELLAEGLGNVSGTGQDDQEQRMAIESIGLHLPKTEANSAIPGRVLAVVRRPVLAGDRGGVAWFSKYMHGHCGMETLVSSQDNGNVGTVMGFRTGRRQ